jgi:thiol-disulfide isomerase/thioredoxin
MDGMNPKEINIYATNMITGERIESKLPIAEDGSFSGEITPGIAGFYQSSIGNLFLIPGKEVKIYTDLKKRSRFQSRHRTDKEPGDSISTYISGTCFTIAEAEAIFWTAYGLFDFLTLAQETVNMNPEQFKQHLLGIMNEKLDEVKQKNYSADMQMMMENAIKLEVYRYLMQYERFINMAYMQVNNIKREDMDKVTFKAEKPEIEYYSFLNGELNDNMSYSPTFSYLIGNLIYADVFNIPDGSDKPAKERFAYFREKFASVSGYDKGLILDVIQAQFYGQQLNDMKFFTDAEKQELRDAFNEKPAFAEALIAENDKMVALIAANTENKECVAHEPPKVSQEKMFDAILANYKGKVVVVDFWATWCGPCMSAMKTIKPLKDEMKGKDVVWLYLTGETSPLNTWMRTYPTISGEHYRVSDAQWQYWYKTYGIKGIPTYMVYDRQGKQLSKYTGFPGVDTMKKDIEKGL